MGGLKAWGSKRAGIRGRVWALPPDKDDTAVAVDTGGAVDTVLPSEDGDGDGYNGDQDCDDGDGDGDGYGDPAAMIEDCDPGSGFVADGTDCDDGNRTIHPGAEEVCNGLDDDCDGVLDDDDAADALTWYADADGDGFGDPTAPTTACAQPVGYVILTDLSAGDCHDTDANAYPGSREPETPLDGIDTDCDGNDFCTDLDCDGPPDLFISANYDGDYSAESHIFYNEGDGFSNSAATALPGYGTHGTAVMDLDGDGYQDLVLANYYTGSTRVTNSYVYWGSSAGYSSSNRSDLPTVGAIEVLAEDLDGNGYIDLVFGGSTSGFSDSDRTDLPTLGAGYVGIGDLDADGWPELVFGNYYTGASYAADSYVYYGGSGYSIADRDDLSNFGSWAKPLLVGNTDW